jgi:hypothetical protein
MLDMYAESGMDALLGADPVQVHTDCADESQLSGKVCLWEAFAAVTVELTDACAPIPASSGYPGLKVYPFPIDNLTIEKRAPGRYQGIDQRMAEEGDRRHFYTLMKSSASLKPGLKPYG